MYYLLRTLDSGALHEPTEIFSLYLKMHGYIYMLTLCQQKFSEFGMVWELPLREVGGGQTLGHSRPSERLAGTDLSDCCRSPRQRCGWNGTSYSRVKVHRQGDGQLWIRVIVDENYDYDVITNVTLSLQLVCVCVWEREREWERDVDNEWEKDRVIKFNPTCCLFSSE